MLSWFRNRRRRKATAQNFYGSIVAQARQADFCAKLHVPDSLEGRFELLVIHVFLVTNALQRAGREYGELTKNLVGLFITDVDATMRELGVSDMRVSKKMHALTDVFYSRMHVYRDALEGKGLDALASVLLEHVYLGRSARRNDSRKLASYMMRCDRKMGWDERRLEDNPTVDFAPIIGRGKSQRRHKSS